ncbi:MAG: class I SAM-dependent methyltransferase [Deltaproteobacteria bacterium]|nr:class I SAM-dependent methyltransferase [Deltaproteobacteria bacterium]
MQIFPFLRLFLLVFALSVPPPAHADEVPYVTTPDNVVDAMLSIAGVGAQDNLVDLGSGDGRIVITAAKKHGAHGVGIEYDKELVAQSRATAKRAGVADKAKFLKQDIFTSDIRKATVVTMYLLPEINLDLRPRILFELRPGTRVVSHDWNMGDWDPDDRRVIPTPGKTVYPLGQSTVYLWIVPARIAGFWRGTLSGPDGEEPVVIEFAQRYQEASATLWLKRWTMAGSGRIRGNGVSLNIDRSSWKEGSALLQFTLRVAKGRLEGEATDGQDRFVLKARRVAD